MTIELIEPSTAGSDQVPLLPIEKLEVYAAIRDGTRDALLEAMRGAPFGQSTYEQIMKAVRLGVEAGVKEWLSDEQRLGRNPLGQRER